uniref:Uncharacterized protein n=1 Tax=viral metagenome TaxID=1070528 RepID=A0A6C0BUN0_9ZZZZ
MKILKISKDSSMDEIDIVKINNKNILKSLTKISTSQGNNKLKLLYRWKYKSNYYNCYGWNDGESGFENKHELPPYGENNFLEKDSSEELLFGDIFIIKKDLTDKKMFDLTVIEYSEFYNYAYGGFEDCDSTSDEEEYNTEEEDEDYIPKSEEEEEEDLGDYNEDEDLEEDKNCY